MATCLVLEFPSATPADIHRIRNFGETLFVIFRDNGLAEISLDEVDPATNRLSVMVPHRRKLRRVEALIERVMAEHHLDRVGTVSRLNPAA